MHTSTIKVRSITWFPSGTRLKTWTTNVAEVDEGVL